MNYNNVINWFFLPFLIVVLMLRTDGAKASHIVCGGFAQLVRGVSTNHFVGEQVCNEV